MEKSTQGGIVSGAGRGALIMAMAGSGWLGWGLSSARAFNATSGPIFGLASILLWICSIYVIRDGRALRRQSLASTGTTAKFPARSFTLIVLVEALAIVVVLLAAAHVRRFDLAALGCALVVGLHYLPLAKIFRAPILMFLGILIVIWCGVSWALFRSDALLIAVLIGTGTLFWAASIAILLRARRITRSLKS